MSVSVVCGVNWGDEGKGRMVDYVSSSADVVVRYQGGNNAGHTVVNEFGKFALHLIPSGIFRPGVLNVLGPGVIVDLEGLANEIDELDARGVDVSNLIVSDRAMVCFPFHRRMDELEEERLGSRAYGSRSEEHTSELQSRENLVCRLLLEKKKKAKRNTDQTEDEHRNEKPATRPS